MTTTLNSSAYSTEEALDATIRWHLIAGNDVIVESFHPETYSARFRQLSEEYEFCFLVDADGRNCKFQKEDPN